MSDITKAENIASKLVAELQELTDELAIKRTTLKYWHEMKKAVSEGNFARCRTSLRKAIQSAFPDKETATPAYYFTNSGKGRIERFEHLALWYATASEDRWEVVGDDARNQYFGNLPELPKTESNQIETSTEATETTKEPAQETHTEATETLQLTLETMNIKTLQLDAETEKKVQEALNYSGLSLADFIQKASSIYATTLTGKAKQFDSDLSAVDTETLLTSKEYSTHPARALELTKRAIRAIILYNSQMASEKKDRWHINQTAIQSLTGSKATKIKEILPQFEDQINSHNSNLELTPYDNRKADKRKIEDIINLAELVPDGMD